MKEGAKMRSLMMFLASCGHPQITEVTDEMWERLTASTTLHPSYGNPVEKYKYPTRIGRKTRMVYISPMRFTCCLECSEL